MLKKKRCVTDVTRYKMIVALHTSNWGSLLVWTCSRY